MEEARRGHSDRPIWRGVLPAFLAGVLVRLAVAYWIHQNHTFIFLDDQGYDLGGWQLASAWKLHQSVSPTTVAGGSTTSWGYFAYIGAIYYVFGHHPLLVAYFNAVISAASALFAGRLAFDIGGSRLVKPVAWTIALYPTGVFWGATGLKDGPLVTLLLAVLVIATTPLTFKRLIVAATLTGALFLVRAPLGVICLVALTPTISQALWRRLRPRGERHYGGRVWLGLVLGGLIVFFIGKPVLQAIWTQVQTSSASETTLPLTSIQPAPPSGYSAVHALLSPLPWTFNPGSIFQIYPGMVIWILALPAAAVGSWRLLRKGTARQKGVLVALGLYLFLYLLAYNATGFTRQRFTVEPFFLVLALFAFQTERYWPELFTEAWIVLVSMVALSMGTGIMLLGPTSILVAGAVFWVATQHSSVIARMTVRSRGTAAFHKVR